VAPRSALTAVDLPILVLAIPAGMVVSYALIVVALYRAGDEFSQVP
jgi:hypothetical protein